MAHDVSQPCLVIGLTLVPQPAQIVLLCPDPKALTPAGLRERRRPDLVSGLTLVSPALPASPDQWRRSLNVGQQLQQVRGRL